MFEIFQNKRLRGGGKISSTTQVIWLLSSSRTSFDVILCLECSSLHSCLLKSCWTIKASSRATSFMKPMLLPAPGRNSPSTTFYGASYYSYALTLMCLSISYLHLDCDLQRIKSISHSSWHFPQDLIHNKHAINRLLNEKWIARWRTIYQIKGENSLICLSLRHGKRSLLGYLLRGSDAVWLLAVCG